MFDMAYRLFLEKSYYLQPAKDGAVYRIDKRGGEVYLVYLNKMRRVEDVTPAPPKTSKFLQRYEKPLLGLEDYYSKEIESKRVSYYIDWRITFIIIGVFICANVFVWIIIQKKRKYASSLP
jgi:hypothetical protein